jgi:hypothetical protein
VELRFPVDCQWGASSDEAPFVVANNIRQSDFANEEAIVNSLAKLMVSQIEIETLQDLTHNSVYVHVGDGYRMMFSSEEVERLEAIASPEERDRQARELLRPCSFGGGTIDVPPEMEEGASIPETMAAQLAGINPPLLMVSTPHGTEAGQVAVIFEVGPMVAKPVEKIAYFPLIVGLTFFADATETKPDEVPVQGWLKFADWSEGQRDELWKLLFAGIAQHLGKLGPDTAMEFKAAVLTINAEIEVRQRENESLEELRHRALAGLQQTGTLVKYESQLGTADDCHALAEIRTALERVEGARGTQEKGESLEHLLELLFNTIKGFRVRNRVRTETEEIDLVIVSSDEVSEFRAEGPIILAECKNWSGHCGKNEFVQFQDKMRNRGERCTLGFLVSWNGFAETITKEMLRSSREKLLIVPLSGNDIKEALRTNTFHDCLIKAWEKALLV